MRTTTIAITSLLFLVAGCGRSEHAQAPADVTEPTPSVVEDPAAVYASAIENMARSDADRERDANRKPDQVLEFFGVEPGMQVLDMYSGGGYYSEIVSYVVGPAGSVMAHSNEAYAQWVGDEVLTRFSNDRLPNVNILMAENNELRLMPNEYDVVLLILSFHDIFHVDVKNGWSKIDGPKFLAELHKGLKPGGVIGIVDHHAEAGSPRETGNTLHRVDPAIVLSDMESAGFVLDGKSNVLRNMEDDHYKNMADPAVRGKTDRFVMRFIKPE